MAKIKKLQEGGATIYPATITNAVKDPTTGKTLTELLGDGVQSDGTYPKMTAGFAENIVGDGSATPEVFSFRPTAGEERNVENTTILYDGAKNGEAKIKVLKGNSVVWNQLLTHEILENSSFPFTINGITFDRNVDGSYSIKGTATSQAQVTFANPSEKSTQGHKYYLHGFSGSAKNKLFFGALSTGLRDHTGIYSQTVETSDFNFAIRVYDGVTVDETAFLYAVDLTKMFCAGNEPQSVAEFYERLPKGVDINAFNGGEIVNGNYGALRTTGFNQFNGTYAKVLGGVKYHLGGTFTSIGFTSEQGGTTEAIEIPSDKFYTPSQNGYIYASGADICISLAWSEYADMQGTYLPYKTFERDLSWVVNKYFNGKMCSAGIAHDDIRFNSTTHKWEAVHRIGVVDLGSLKWLLRSEDANTFFTSIPNKSVGGDVIVSKYTNVGPINNILTLKDKEVGTTNANTNIFIKDSTHTDVNAFKSALQGVMLNYELAEPDVKEITENVNLNFDCADYGTEELIVAEGEKSAPLSADIIYQPNAVQTLKQVPDILRRLNALESALAQQTTNEEPSNVE